MKTKEFLALLDDMLELDPGTLTGAEQLSDIPEWDSLAVISFIALVDEQFDLILEGEKLAEAKSVRDLINLLGGRVTD
ncbi:MAG TPA: acyl carrier protein [Aliidongia sp.]|nr:acyl carrier protein [Aliidongia sp.]